MVKGRVFHLSANRYPPLPTSHHSLKIWEELSQGVEDYHVIASSGSLRYSHTRKGNIHLHLLPTLGKRAWAYFFSSWLILFLGWFYRPDRVIAQCPVHGGIAGSMLCKTLKVPLLCEIHGSHYFRAIRRGWLGKLEHLLYKFLSSFTFQASSVIRTLSTEMTQQLATVYGAAISSKAIVIPNRVDLNVFSPSKQNFAIDGALKVVTVGSYTAIKGHRSLIEDLFRCTQNAELFIVGRGPLATEYIRIATELGVVHRLHLLSAATHKDVAKLLAASDIYIHYSLAEGVPRAILEAMAMGLPVICSPAGFLGGVVTHGYDVLLIGGKGIGTLEMAMTTILESESLRCRLGHAARATIEERFEWNLVFNLYRDVISGMAAT